MTTTTTTMMMMMTMIYLIPFLQFLVEAFVVHFHLFIVTEVDTGRYCLLNTKRKQ